MLFRFKPEFPVIEFDTLSNSNFCEKIVSRFSDFFAPKCQKSLDIGTDLALGGELLVKASPVR